MTDEGIDHDGEQDRNATTSDGTEGADSTDDDQHLLKPSLRRFPWLRASGAAAVTLAVQYVLVTLAFVVGPSSLDRSSQLFSSVTERLLQYAFVLYNAHHVPLITVAPNAQVPGSPFTNVLYGSQGASIPPWVYFALPIVALLVAGGIFELRREGNRAASELEESALVGTGFAVGYAVVGTVGSLVLVRRIPLRGAEGVATTGPAIVWALVASVLFPLVFASIGAAIAYSYDESRSEGDEA